MPHGQKKSPASADQDNQKQSDGKYKEPALYRGMALRRQFRKNGFIHGPPPLPEHYTAKLTGNVRVPACPGEIQKPAAADGKISRFIRAEGI
jgi:hypothetical protein